MLIANATCGWNIFCFIIIIVIVVVVVVVIFEESCWRRIV